MCLGRVLSFAKQAPPVLSYPEHGGKTSNTFARESEVQIKTSVDVWALITGPWLRGCASGGCNPALVLFAKPCVGPEEAGLPPDRAFQECCLLTVCSEVHATTSLCLLLCGTSQSTKFRKPPG